MKNLKLVLIIEAIAIICLVAGESHYFYSTAE